MGEKNKTNKICMEIQDMLDGITKEELGKASVVEYYEKLAKLKYYLCKCSEEDEKQEYSQRMGRSYAYDSYREGPEWGAYADGSMRRNALGQFTSYGMDTKMQLREMMQDPKLNYEAKEHLRKAMEACR